MTKKIGLVFWKVGDNSFGSTIPYIRFAERFGEVIPLMPSHTVREDLDLLIIPGGADVNPANYEEVPHYFTGKPDLYKEHFDRVYLQQYIDAGVPIFGICRAHQSIATHFGGKLVQHMYHETTNTANAPTDLVHRMTFTNEFTTKTNFTLKRNLLINSRHHQVVDERGLPEELVVIGRHMNKQSNYSDNSIEMIAHRNLPIVTLQSHAEDTYDDDTTPFIHKTIMHLINTKTSILQ